MRYKNKTSDFRRLKFHMSLVEQIKIICLQEGRGFQRAILLMMDLLLQQHLQLLLLRAVALLAALTTKKSSTNDDEVDNCAQEATVCDTVPWQFREVFNVSGPTTGLRISGVMISPTKWSDDSVESIPHNNGYSRSRITLEQKSLVSLIIWQWILSFIYFLIFYLIL